MEFTNKVNKDLSAENFSRMKILSIAFFSLGVFFLLTDLAFINLYKKEVSEGYILLDIIFTVLSIIAMLYFWFVKNYKYNNLAVKISVSYIVLWAVMICAIDFSGIGISTYVSALVLSLLYLHFKPAFFNALIWVSTFLLFGILYYRSSSISEILPTIFVLMPVSLFATFISHRYYKEKIHSLNIFHENEKLTQELKLAKDNLTLEVEKKTKSLVDTNIELEKSRSKIKLEKDRFEALIDKLQQGVLYLNTEGDILEVNNSILQILGSPTSDSIKSINILGSQALIEYGFTEKYKECIENKCITNGNGCYKTSWDVELFAEYYFVPIMENGLLVGILACIEDYTEKKRIENELISAKEKAEESNRLKSAFLSNMSHEIRTPMNGILGFTSLLLEPDLTGEQKQSYIEIINESGIRMLNTVNDIIEISKIEAGQISVNLSEVSINQVLGSIFTFFKHETDKKGLKFDLNNDLSDIDAFVYTDKEKLYSVITNLVKNAIKFCDKGSINFGCSKKGNEFEFYVKDTGVGIQEDRKEAVFERFVKADIANGNAQQGSGLGLAITKSYIEALGGKIWVQSKVNVGSTFFFTLPLNFNNQEMEPEEKLTAS
jgi:PAS domain S-box-containing protein